MATCRHCAKAEYHDYKDQHGIRCPLCGEKEKQVKVEPIIKAEEPKRAPRATRSK